MTKQELLNKTKGYFSFNKEVAKLLPNKTMTRRVIKGGYELKAFFANDTLTKDQKDYLIEQYSKYQIGDILWIREPVKVRIFTNINKIYYYFSDERDKGLANKSIDIPERFKDLKHKPKWLLNEQGVPNGCLKEMARYFIKIINVRVEKLQNITCDDIPKGYKLEDNPFVFVYEWGYIEYKE